MESSDGASRSAAEPTSRRSSPRSERGSSPTSGRVEWLLVAALLAIPMAVVPGDGAPTLVSLWGFVTLGGDGAGLGGYPVWAYFLDQPRPFATLPPSIRAWPLALGFHLLAAGSATSGIALGREDRRVTGGLLVLAAAATLWVAAGLGVRFGVGTTAGWFSVLPASAVATLLVAGWAYGGDLRGIVVR
ncbi:TIGR04206 family protein [Halorubrum sp. Atlit-8R]|uniref:TIGR04206 family protein n=1 Tax=unclassified Halorubrum TaxID=2642239 RepID=UPI000EF18399|nr:MULTISPECIES: TIGR04206 family protein [unclassified Halorubrum]RLM70734.1 TIGR04206 family protein [Halorubrum sp. Atlit-9R]RLM83110.1 TIGR04206 family protein [Halorubrum sp. Atlit-8R]